jgi:hypothetical protein
MPKEMWAGTEAAEMAEAKVVVVMEGAAMEAVRAAVTRAAEVELTVA